VRALMHITMQRTPPQIFWVGRHGGLVLPCNHTRDENSIMAMDHNEFLGRFPAGLEIRYCIYEHRIGGFGSTRLALWAVDIAIIASHGGTSKTISKSKVDRSACQKTPSTRLHRWSVCVTHVSVYRSTWFSRVQLVEMQTMVMQKLPGSNSAGEIAP
jgi:hypothetical protein